MNNQAICAHAAIQGFPTLKYYTPNYTRSVARMQMFIINKIGYVPLHSTHAKNIMYNFRGDEGVNSPNEHHEKDEMKSDVIDFLEDMIETLEDEDVEAVWPHLGPINVNSRSSCLVLLCPALVMVVTNTPLSAPSRVTVSMFSTLGFTDLWPEGNEDTFIVVESEASYVGKEVRRETIQA